MSSFKVLSIDGGGIRGIIPSVVLQEIERITGRSVSELFDLIAGTSTGGIIACALATPGPSGQPKFSAKDLMNFYVEEGPDIFWRSPLRTLLSLNGWIEEKYPTHQFERELMHFFGITHFSAALTPLLIPAYEIERRLPFFFKSHRAMDDPSYDYPMWQVARATSAAPTYFEPALVTAKTRETYTLIDEGTFANNPAMCAYAEVEVAFRANEDILIVSLGTGHQDRPILYKEAKRWGKVQWAAPVLDVMMDGVNDTVDYQLRQLLAPEHYFRFQTELTFSDDDMDDASLSNTQRLIVQGERLVEREQERLEELCEVLMD
jgi:patatin-like phospholipase/acyl hydrolase